MSEDNYTRLVGLLRNKKNIILQGAPGVGKTYAAKRLAYSMMGVKDVERVMMVQFHQSYSYEDFIMGFRPFATGFELKKGAFYNFCKKVTYVKNKEYELREKDHTVSGMLLYAKTDEEIYPNNVYQMSGNQITVRTLDLKLPFDEIAGQLNTIAKTQFDL